MAKCNQPTPLPLKWLICGCPNIQWQIHLLTNCFSLEFYCIGMEAASADIRSGARPQAVLGLIREGVTTLGSFLPYDVWTLEYHFRKSFRTNASVSAF